MPKTPEGLNRNADQPYGDFPGGVRNRFARAVLELHRPAKLAKPLGLYLRR